MAGDIRIATEIIKILGSGALQQIGIWWGVKDELDKLKRKVFAIDALLPAAEQSQTQDFHIKDWLRELQDVVYDAEDLLDDFSTEALIRKVKSGNKITKQVRGFFSRPNRIVYGYKMGRKIKKLRGRLDEIETNIKKIDIVRRQVAGPPFLTTPFEAQSTDSIVGLFIGRDKDKKAILSHLLDSNSSENVMIIPIVGMGGLGKTALAQCVYNEEKVQSHFEPKLWIDDPNPFHVQLVIRKILNLLTESNQENLALEQLRSRLRKGIDGRKYLLVLDNVWDEDIEVWEELKKTLKFGAPGSRIIVTTRTEMVPRGGTSRLCPHVLEGLSLDESWSLFTTVFFEGRVPKTCSSNLLQIGMEIVRKCAGVPLAIKTIGRVLYEKDPDTQWLPILKNGFSGIYRYEKDVMHTLQLSYNDLPSHLKRCFAYCSLFPKGHELHVETLVKLWIAQGLVESSDTSLSLEESGLDCFMKLLRRSFFQEVVYDGLERIVRCKMNDLMHDLAFLVAGSEITKLNPNVDEVGEKLLVERKHHELTPLHHSRYLLVYPPQQTGHT